VFNPALYTYLKIADQWRDVFGVFLKINGEWVPVAGVNSNYAPVFATNTDNFGINARGINPEPGVISWQWFGWGRGGAYSGFGDGGGGGGGGKIICTKLYELGLMSKDIYEADKRLVLNWCRCVQTSTMVIVPGLRLWLTGWMAVDLK
jgi:hypothetical protein